MAYQNNLECLAFEANEDLSGKQFRVVELTGAPSKVKLVDAADIGFGILQNNPKSAEAATVAVYGQSKAIAAVAVTAGQRLKPTSGGFLTPVGSAGNAASYVMVGRALTTAASGQLMTIHLDPQVVINSGSALA